MSDANFTPNFKPTNKLTPFKFFMLQNFPYIAEDFDSITTYELMCKLAEQLNSMITNVNNVIDNSDSLLQAYNQLQDYVNNYFNNLDVQEEINNKLDQMVTDGTFDTIINQKLFGQLNDKINQNTNDILQNANDILQNTTDIETLKKDMINKYSYYEVDNIEDFKKYIESAEHCYIRIKKEKNTGIYSFTETQFINSNKYIVIDDDVKITNTLNFIFYDPNNPNVTKYNGFENITIIGGNWENTCFSIAHAKNITFNNINYKNANQNHIFQIASSMNVKILNSNFVGMCEYKESDGIKDNPTKDMINIDPMTSVSFPVFEESAEFYDNYINNNIIIDNCSFSPNESEQIYNHAYSGIGAHSYNKDSNNKYHKNITISNCIFNKFSVHAIRLTTMQNVKILHNECYNSYRFITVYNLQDADISYNFTNAIKNFLYVSSEQVDNAYINCNRLNISKNYIRYTKDLDGTLYPLNQNGTIIDFFHIRESMICDNIIMNSEIMFLRLTDSAKITIANNQFTSINVANGSTIIDCRHDNVKEIYLNNNTVYGIKNNSGSGNVYLVRFNFDSKIYMFSNTVTQDSSFSNMDGLFMADTMPFSGDISRRYDLNNSNSQEITIDENVECISKIVVFIGASGGGGKSVVMYPFFNNFRVTNKLEGTYIESGQAETLTVEFKANNKIKLDCTGSNGLRYIRIFPLFNALK